MLRRFAAASSVVSCLIAMGSVALIAIRLIANQRYYQISVLWCLLPMTWGIWSVLTPKPWFPARLPAWGAVLGAMVGTLGAFAINVPQRVLGISLSIGWRLFAVVLAAAAYYLLWMLVGPLYRALTPTAAPIESSVKAA